MFVILINLIKSVSCKLLLIENSALITMRIEMHVQFNRTFFKINIMESSLIVAVTVHDWKMVFIGSSLFLALVPIVLSKSQITKALCGLRTNELIEYYGYAAEVHTVTTKDGYILTVFRCNSKNASATPKKPVLLQHGLLVSSDDFCINPPDQALAYVLADAGYDVWLSNSRGSVYSRKHAHEDPNKPFGNYWNFSWYEMGIYDQPAVIDYVLKQTNHTDLYYIGYSQGTTSVMVLLSEKPEYNKKIRAASLLAPVGYLDHDGMLYQVLSLLAPYLRFVQSSEVLPRARLLNKLINLVCDADLSLCNAAIDIICGESENQRNDTMMPAFFCHIPSGASFKQILHYGQEIRLGFFGKFMNSKMVPADFQLSRITTPMSLHYSTADLLADATDAQRLIPMLKNSDIYVQAIEAPFNHIDFVWGMHSASLIYSKILTFFEKHKLT